ncbi:MAG: ScaI family restriction endonuclease [Terriglobales bacterium]|jgi:hypothetical protein
MSSFPVSSPYAGLPQSEWRRKTAELIERHPLKPDVIVAVVLQSWQDIFLSKIGQFSIGKDLFPKPQIMGFFLHELIPLEFEARFPGAWRGDKTGADKDLVYIPDQKYSVEIKTSSHASQIFGNRSYAQDPEGSGKKSKAGYYLAVNFMKFVSAGERPGITRIRFGWLDHSDWMGQRAATGQQAHLDSAVEGSKLILLYPK